MTIIWPDKPLKRFWATLNAAGLWTVAMLVLWLIPSPCLMGHWREQIYGFFGPYSTWRPGPQWTDIFTGNYRLDLHPIAFSLSIITTLLVSRILWLRYIFIVTGSRRPFLFMTSRVARRRSHGLCPACGYDLCNNFDNGCPECGWLREE